jgi:type I restriction enzyme R subunit
MSHEIHQEVVFEDEICGHLLANGWVFDGPLPHVKSHVYDAGYDRKLALYPTDAIAWVKETQLAIWAKFESRHANPAQAEKEFARLLAEELSRERKTIKKDDPKLWGSLHVLRRSFKPLESFKMAQFAPANAKNAELWDHYNKNILRVVRQVHYSLHNEKCIDLVLFLNGIPVATIEIKVDTTQSIEDAVKQYRTERLPKDKATNTAEPLLSFGQRALVHFALSSDEVRMTTRLNGDKTRFLPFNKGIPDGMGGATAGNAPDKMRGHATAYFWHEVLERKTFLDILGKFVSIEVKESKGPKADKKALSTTLLFPRYHQLDAVTSVLGATLKEGVGQTYLVQHSAGSGKSNTIGWAAHRLSNLFDAQDNKVFTSVIAITDRRVLDQQLQDTLKQFEATPGVVVKIDENSSQLAEALDDKASIIVTTLQKFPFVLKKVGSMQDRTFAVIIDEAHSSQSGKTAIKLREALTSDGNTTTEDGSDDETELTSEEVIAKLMEARKRPPNVSYYAFTATPKAKTLELFGRKNAEGLPEPFHVYSMRQAIDEEFILDVLKGYTTYDLAFKLEQTGPDIDVKSGKARTKIFKFANLHPTSIGQKIAIITEHFRKHVAHLLNGQAKAMVVTDSRQAAVRYKIEFDRYMAKMGYRDFKALVAYSGKISDGEYSVKDADEGDINGGKHKVKDDGIKEAFSTDEYKLLIVANKFQVGFDEPLLCAMYVDKRLDDVMAVQTLSRLNRTYPGKKSTFVLDFRNDAKDILEAFRPYYRTAELSGITDRALPHQLREKLDDAGVYTQADVDAFADLFFKSRDSQPFQAYLKQAKDNYSAKLKSEEQELFRRDAQSYVAAYDFLSQIVDYDNPDLEKLHAFMRMLLPRLRGKTDDPILLDKAIRLANYKIVNKQDHDLDLKVGEAKPLGPYGVGGGEPFEDPNAKLSEIINKIHSLFSGKFSDADVMGWYTNVVGNTATDDTILKEAKAASSMEQFAKGSFEDRLAKAIINGLASQHALSDQALRNKQVFQDLAAMILPEVFEQARNPQQSIMPV